VWYNGDKKAGTSAEEATMPKPRTGLIRSEAIYHISDYPVEVVGLLKAYDSVHDYWFVYGVRCRCQGDGCDDFVDTPIAKRPAPASSSTAAMMIAATLIEPRGCVKHPPMTWRKNAEIAG
jgi:hypothetical protein